MTNCGTVALSISIVSRPAPSLNRMRRLAFQARIDDTMGAVAAELDCGRKSENSDDGEACVHVHWVWWDADVVGRSGWLIPVSHLMVVGGSKGREGCAEVVAGG